MKTKFFLPIAILVIATISGTLIFLSSNKLTKIPDISLNLIDGRKINFNSFAGKPLLITFWPTTCATCIKEMPHLAELYHELHKDGFEIIGIAMPYDPPNIVIELSEQRSIPYPIALDIQGIASEAFGNINVTPTSFLIDSYGKIIQEEKGEINIEQLRSKIKMLLKPSSSEFS